MNTKINWVIFVITGLISSFILAQSEGIYTIPLYWGMVQSEPTPAPPITHPVFDEDRSDDNLVQVNNLRIVKINLSTSSDVKAYFYVVRDIGWKCVSYKSPDIAVSSVCPLNIRKPIIQQELVIKISYDTVLLLRNRKKADISQFNVGDKINFYGFMDGDNFTIDALVVRKIVSSTKLPGSKPPEPIVNFPVQPLPVPTTTLPISELPLQWFTGYLEKIPFSTPHLENNSEVTTRGSPIFSNQNNPTHMISIDNNIFYLVAGVDENARSLLEKYSNQRVRLHAFVVSRSTTNNSGLLLAKNVIPLSLSSETSPSPTSTKRLPLKSVSGLLKETGVSIYMWGSHTLVTDDGMFYLVKALTKDVEKDLVKNTGKKVMIYAKEIYYNNLEGGFWAIEAEKVVPLK